MKFIYKNKETGLYRCREMRIDTPNIMEADVFPTLTFLIGSHTYQRIEFESEVKRIRKEKLKKLNNET